MGKIACGIRSLKTVLIIIFATIITVVPALAAPKGDKGNGGGKGNGQDSGNTVGSAEAALGFLKSQMGPVGLVDSFVEDNADYAYTYDNALSAMAFISSGDLTSAAAVFDAYVVIGAEPDGGVLHRYRASDGGSAYGLPGVGHNAYLLQAMTLYRLESEDTSYDGFALGIADYLLAHQDSDGGLFGRAGVTWKSTENNLAAYSALVSAGTVFEIPTYLDKAELLRTFLVTECWDGMRFLTGKDDPMIVTDVQALGVMVLGSSYAGGAYWVEAYTLTTQRYKGRKRVTGFDLNTDRDTVWTEGTLQQAMAFLLASDISRAEDYKKEAEKLLQSSGAFWQASNAGTSGFGDTFMRWQAAAPTAWYVFLANQDNVLEPFL
jgi:uncharacterized protein YyaL (SSP411 family)